MGMLDAVNSLSNVYTANKMRKMENNILEFSISSAIATAFYEMKFDQIKRIMIKGNSIFDDLEEFSDSDPVYHCMVASMVGGILANLNFSEEIFSDISDMEYANKFSKRLKRLTRKTGSHSEEIQDQALQMYNSLGEGNADRYSDQIPDEGDALSDTLELIESVSDFIGPQLSAEWIKEPGMTSKFEISVSVRGIEYNVKGKKKHFLTEHYGIEIDGEAGFETTEKQGVLNLSTIRGVIPLGKDAVGIEFSPMGNITLSCEQEVIELKHV